MSVGDLRRADIRLQSFRRVVFSKIPAFIEIACNGGTIFEGRRSTCCIELGEVCFAYIRYHFLKSIFMGMLEFAQNLPLLR